MTAAALTLLTACGPGSGETTDDRWTIGNWFIMPDHCAPPERCPIEGVELLGLHRDGFAVNKVENPCATAGTEMALEWEIVDENAIDLRPADPDAEFRFNGTVTPETHVEFRRRSECTAQDSIAGSVWTKGTVELVREGEQCNGYMSFVNSEDLCLD